MDERWKLHTATLNGFVYSPPQTSSFYTRRPLWRNVVTMWRLVTQRMSCWLWTFLLDRKFFSLHIVCAADCSRKRFHVDVELFIILSEQLNFQSNFSIDVKQRIERVFKFSLNSIDDVPDYENKVAEMKLSVTLFSLLKVKIFCFNKKKTRRMFADKLS